MKDNRKKVVEFLHQQGRAKSNTLADVVGGTMGDVLAVLNVMVEEGKAKQADGGYYSLTNSYRAELDHPLALDPEKQLLLQLLDIYDKSGWVGRMTLANWLGVDSFRVRELQRTLVRKRMLRLGKDGKYTLVRKRSAAA